MDPNEYRRQARVLRNKLLAQENIQRRARIEVHPTGVVKVDNNAPKPEIKPMVQPAPPKPTPQPPVQKAPEPQKGCSKCRRQKPN